MGPFLFKLLWPFGNGPNSATFPLHWKCKHTASAWPGNTPETSSRLLSPPTPSHSIPQEQLACVHNFPCLLPWPQIISLRLSAFTPGVSRFLWLLFQSQHLHTTARGLQACILWQEGHGISQQQKPASHPTTGKIASCNWACKEPPNPANVLTWSWHEPTGDCLAAPAAECGGARLAGLSPNFSCSTARGERLVIFLQVSYCLCLAHSQKHLAACGHLQRTYPPKGGDHKLGLGACPSQGVFLSAG